MQAQVGGLHFAHSVSAALSIMFPFFSCGTNTKMVLAGAALRTKGL